MRIQQFVKNVTSYWWELQILINASFVDRYLCVHHKYLCEPFQFACSLLRHLNQRRNIFARIENNFLQRKSFMRKSLNTFVDSSVCMYSFWVCSDPVDTHYKGGFVFGAPTPRPSWVPDVILLFISGKHGQFCGRVFFCQTFGRFLRVQKWHQRPSVKVWSFYGRWLRCCVWRAEG